MSLIIPFSEACERNKDPILERLSPYLKDGISVLEIGTGTGQHVVHFAPANNEVIWQPTDQAQYLDGIAAQLQTRSIANINPALELDVTVRVALNKLVITDANRIRGAHRIDTMIMRKMKIQGFAVQFLRFARQQ